MQFQFVLSTVIWWMRILLIHSFFSWWCTCVSCFYKKTCFGLDVFICVQHTLSSNGLMLKSVSQAKLLISLLS